METRMYSSILTVAAAAVAPSTVRAARRWVSPAMTTQVAWIASTRLTANAGKRLVQGMDVTAVYELPTERFGKFTFSGGWNHFFTWKAEPGDGAGASASWEITTTAHLPLAPGAIPWNKGFLRGEWEWRHFDFVATGNYIGDFRDDPVRFDQYCGPTAGAARMCRATSRSTCS